MIERVEAGDPGITSANISQEKWGLTSERFVKVTTVMLENTARELGKANMITEDAPANQSGAFPNATNLKGFDPILISLIRRAMPNLIAYDLCGVQPMTGPTGLIFAMKSKYNSQGDAEALFYEANTAFSDRKSTRLNSSHT